MDVGSLLVMEVRVGGSSLRPDGAGDVHVEGLAIEIARHQMLHNCDWRPNVLGLQEQYAQWAFLHRNESGHSVGPD
jgi:hypothetical protein